MHSSQAKHLQLNPRPSRCTPPGNTLRTRPGSAPTARRRKLRPAKVSFPRMYECGDGVAITEGKRRVVRNILTEGRGAL